MSRSTINENSNLKKFNPLYTPCFKKISPLPRPHTKPKRTLPDILLNSINIYLSTMEPVPFFSLLYSLPYGNVYSSTSLLPSPSHLISCKDQIFHFSFHYKHQIITEKQYNFTRNKCTQDLLLSLYPSF